MVWQKNYLRRIEKKIFLKIILSGYKMKPNFDNLVYVVNYLMEKGSPEIDKLVPGHIMIDLKNKFPKSR